MKVKFKKINEKAVLPAYGTKFSAGMDLVPVEGPTLTEQYVEYKFGFAMEVPLGYAAFIFPRSSVSKTDLELCNSVGIIDADYRGEVMARFNFNQFSLDFLQRFNIAIKSAPYFQRESIIKKFMNELTYFKDGKAILQMIILPVPKIEPEWTDKLSDSARGAGGFGSTDK